MGDDADAPSRAISEGLSSQTRYHGSVWGDLPEEYPQDTAERAYRALLDIVGPRPAQLMGQGFNGVAYRWRTASECHIDYLDLVSEYGEGPPTEVRYLQEKALFGFFTSGLAAIECFSFALHALGAHVSSGRFPIDDKSLRQVTPTSVSKKYRSQWPNSALSESLSNLVEDSQFELWKDIRNVLSHRAAPPRHHYLNSGSEWAIEEAGMSDANQPVEDLTTSWWLWLVGQINVLWRDLDDLAMHIR